MSASTRDRRFALGSTSSCATARAASNAAERNARLVGHRVLRFLIDSAWVTGKSACRVPGRTGAATVGRGFHEDKRNAVGSQADQVAVTITVDRVPPPSAGRPRTPLRGRTASRLSDPCELREGTAGAA
jgi:hypothetical protein